MDWVYLASPVQGNEADTVSFALQEHVISRPARNSKGRLIPNVSHLSPGDRILLAYRRPRHGPVARVMATIGTPKAAVDGTTAIDEVRDTQLVEELRSAGFGLAHDPKGKEVAQVIHLVDVAECEMDLFGAYEGQTTLRRLDQRDTDRPSEKSSPAPPPLPQPLAPRAASTPPLAPQSELVVDSPDWRQERRPVFDAYLMVDWAGGATPSTGENSIWLAYGEWNAERRLALHTINPATRHAAVDTLINWCRALSGKRVLVGLDFAFGYPRGFARAANLPGAAPLEWNAVHQYLATQVSDRPDNKHNIYAVAEGLNESIGGGGPGPFWGCPAARVQGALTTRRIGNFAFPYQGIAEWRLAEQRARTQATTQSVWKLNCGVSVGGQTILGIHRLQQIRRELDGRASIWPFETGWGVPERADAVVLAEIFPSVLPLVDVVGGGVKDERQVRSCVWHAAIRDIEGTLERAFAQPERLNAQEASAAAGEEGWILFV